MRVTEMVNFVDAALLSIHSEQKVRHSKQLTKGPTNNELMHVEFICIRTLFWLLSTSRAEPFHRRT